MLQLEKAQLEHRAELAAAAREREAELAQQRAQHAAELQQAQQQAQQAVQQAQQESQQQQRKLEESQQQQQWRAAEELSSARQQAQQEIAERSRCGCCLWRRLFPFPFPFPFPFSFACCPSHLCPSVLPLPWVYPAWLKGLGDSFPPSLPPIPPCSALAGRMRRHCPTSRVSCGPWAIRTVSSSSSWSSSSSE